MDEPTNTLDPSMRDELLEQVREAGRQGQAVLFSSHVLSEVEQVSPRVAVLRDGRLVHVQTMAALPRPAGPARLNGSPEHKCGCTDSEKFQQQKWRSCTRYLDEVHILTHRTGHRISTRAEIRMHRIVDPRSLAFRTLSHNGRLSWLSSDEFNDVIGWCAAS